VRQRPTRSLISPSVLEEAEARRQDRESFNATTRRPTQKQLRQEEVELDVALELEIAGSAQRVGEEAHCARHCPGPALEQLVRYVRRHPNVAQERVHHVERVEGRHALRVGVERPRARRLRGQINTACAVATAATVADATATAAARRRADRAQSRG